MSANLLTAIINIVNSKQYHLKQTYIKANRANSMGEALEKYIVDSFANTILENDETRRNLAVNNVFSYIGNNTNPPDAMLKGGAAIEIKKIETRSAHLQLNSSSPKAKLHVDDPKLKKSAREAEKWTEKNFIYAIGLVEKEDLKELALIDASIYCADKAVYNDIFDKLKTGIANIENLEFSPSQELGRLNRVDPLGITDYRLRGMWLLSNPFKVFNYVYTPKQEANFNLLCLLSSEKFKKFPEHVKLRNLAKSNPNLVIANVQVKDPNNPARLIDCTQITFHF